MQIAGLLAILAVPLVALLTWVFLKKLPGRTSRTNLAVAALLALGISSLMAWLIFNGLAEGYAYGVGWRDRGRAYAGAQSPGTFWLLIAFYFCGAVLGLSLAAALGIRLLRGKAVIS